MTTRKISLRSKIHERRARMRPASNAGKVLESTSMVPLMRCSPDPNACPASGSIVAVLLDAESHTCIVCGRAIRIRGRLDRRGQILGRVPSHRRADFEERDDARARARSLRCRFDQAEKSVQGALSRRAWARASRVILRAREIAEVSPGDEQIQRRLHRLEVRVFEARAEADRARSAIPKNPKYLLREIVDASAFDVYAVEPDGWIDHLAAALPERTLLAIARQPSTSWIRLGLVALLKRAAPRSWDDLEGRPFAGQRSVMAFIREFPGLEPLRLPDRAYESGAVIDMIDDGAPF